MWHTRESPIYAPYMTCARVQLGAFLVVSFMIEARFFSLGSNVHHQINEGFFIVTALTSRAMKGRKRAVWMIRIRSDIQLCIRTKRPWLLFISKGKFKYIKSRTKTNIPYCYAKMCFAWPHYKREKLAYEFRSCEQHSYKSPIHRPSSVKLSLQL